MGVFEFGQGRGDRRVAANDRIGDIDDTRSSAQTA